MNRILLVLQLATLGLVAYVALRPPPGQAEAAAAAAAGRGQSLEAAGSFAAAALAYEQAAALDPTQAGPRFDAARRAEALGAIAAPELPGREVWARLDAVASALEAGGVAESVAVGRILRLVLARAAGLRAEALAQLAKLVEAGEKSPWFAWHAGSLRLEEARLAEARELLEGLVKAQPGFGAGWHRLAMTYVADGRHEAAIDLGTATGIAQRGMDVIREVDRRRPSRQLDHPTLRRQRIDAAKPIFAQTVEQVEHQLGEHRLRHSQPTVPPTKGNGGEQGDALRPR